MKPRKQNKGTARKSRHPICELPFVKDTPKGRNFWAVKKSDDPEAAVPHRNRLCAGVVALRGKARK